MLTHPDSTLPEETLRSSYANLLDTLAREEPEALRRAAALMDAEAARHAATLPEGSPGARLARTWLALAGDISPTAAPERARVFTFSYPAHVIFQVAAGSVPAARRLARRGVAELLASDAPLGALAGPLPASPSLSNTVVWLGSVGEEKDVLELELVD